MHYRKNSFSKNGKITIKTLDPANQNVIGQRKGVRIFDGMYKGLFTYYVSRRRGRGGKLNADHC